MPETTVRDRARGSRVGWSRCSREDGWRGLRCYACWNVGTPRRPDAYCISGLDDSCVDERVPCKELCLREVGVLRQKWSQRHRRPIVDSDRAGCGCAKCFAIDILTVDVGIQIHEACYSNASVDTDMLTGCICCSRESLRTHRKIDSRWWVGVLKCSVELLVASANGPIQRRTC